MEIKLCKDCANYSRQHPDEKVVTRKVHWCKSAVDVVTGDELIIRCRLHRIEETAYVHRDANGETTSHVVAPRGMGARFFQVKSKGEGNHE